MSRYYNQQKSQCRRFGMTEPEDYLEQCLIQMGLPVKRRQVFCFICLNMWTNNTNDFPDKCGNCDVTYSESRMCCMPDLVMEDPGRHGKAVIFIQSEEYHSSKKAKAKDQFQINVLKKNNWKVFQIYNEEINLLKHANRCFLLLGMFRASLDLTMYLRANEHEKELIH